MSYSNFHYENLTLIKSAMDKNSTITVGVTVTNTGKRNGKESVLMFITDHYASITPAVKELRGFDKINLAPGESKKVKFEITADELSFIDNNFKKVTEPGKFSVSIGDLTKEFELIH